ncbi:ABC transporter substrate-binding protein [Pseudonocardia kunmingensis]|uniref:Peptide/nickel transport system substrate-binding protein n=1 Tax=Pseudonocardia kunmingensis TaxID=630975 RepID=A0A543CZ11_9PSEU|nr:ABC transporter substrate-binding protein [Pseudonocardia kunmingensis]TQM02128.1 peptide/nickel transport system substrate-binding protein [Pseudonocardia kunmingensis]
MKRLTGLSIAGVVLLVVTACGGGGGGTGGAGVEREAQTAACPPATGGVDEGATLTWMYSVGNTSFDPDKITTNNSQMYLYPVYDSLVHVDEEGTPQPMLAESWELTDGGTVLQLELRDGWSYHDGTPFDAESVKANIERGKQPWSYNANALQAVTSVEVVDADTVRLVTGGGAGALVGILGGSAGMMMSPAAFDKPGEDIAPTGGSGAFRMTNYVPGSRVEYTAVEDYWDPEAVNVATLVFLISGDDNARLNAVQTGAADVTFLRASMYQPAVDSGLVVCEAPSLSSYNLTLNTARSEFGSTQVRQAINHAINRDAIAAVTNGFCEPGVQLFPQFYFASNPDIGPERYPYDPERARQLLAEAGVPDGFSFDLEVINLDLYQQIAEVIQQNLAEVGIQMSITPVEIAKLAEDFSVNKSADATLSEQKAESDPSILTASYYLADGFNNPGGFTTEEITRLHAEAMAGATADERRPAYAQLFEAVTEEAYPNVTLCHLTTPFAMNDTVRGVEIYADASRQFRGAGIEPGP